MHININTNAMVVFSNRLEKLRKSALPNAVRNTLNKAAFDVKQVTMPVSADKHMIKRKPNFLKANSKVVMAQGYEINSMKSVIGFTPMQAQYNNFAVRELEQQENSGTISNRTFVPLDVSRSGGSHSSQILPSNRLKVIKNIINSAKSKGRSKKEQFVRAALAAGKKGFVIGNLGKKTLFRINTIKKDKNGKIVIGKTPLYSFQQGRSVRIRKATHFMRDATYITAKKINRFYVSEAQRQFQRVLK